MRLNHEKIVLFMYLFESGDYKNKHTAKNKFFMKKIDGFVRFCIPVLCANIKAPWG